MASCVCDECGKSFMTKKNLKRHKNCHLSGKFTCLMCFSKFSSQKILEDHKKGIHGKSLASREAFICDVCGKNFSAKRTLQEHKKLYLGQDFKYKECSSSFKTESSLKQHQINVHTKENYLCEQCPKTFTCKANLKQHVKTHNVGDNSMKCDYCESTFSSKSKLKHHTLKCMIPKRPQDLTCTDCAKSFSGASSLKNRLKTKILSDAQRPREQNLV